MSENPPQSRVDRRGFLGRLAGGIGLGVAAPALLGQVINDGPRPRVDLELDLREGWLWKFRFIEELAEKTGDLPSVKGKLDMLLEMESRGEDDRGLFEIVGRYKEAKIVRSGQEDVEWSEEDPDGHLRNTYFSLLVAPTGELLETRSGGPLSTRFRTIRGPWKGMFSSRWLTARLGPVFDAEGRVGQRAKLGDRWIREIQLSLGSLPARAVVEGWYLRFVAEAIVGMEGSAQASDKASGLEIQGTLESRWETTADLLAERVEDYQGRRAAMGKAREYRVRRRRTLRRQWAKRPPRGP